MQGKIYKIYDLIILASGYLHKEEKAFNKRKDTLINNNHLLSNQFKTEIDILKNAEEKYNNSSSITKYITKYIAKSKDIAPFIASQKEKVEHYRKQKKQNLISYNNLLKDNSYLVEESAFYKKILNTEIVRTHLSSLLIPEYNVIHRDLLSNNMSVRDKLMIFKAQINNLIAKQSHYIAQKVSREQKEREKKIYEKNMFNKIKDFVSNAVPASRLSDISEHKINLIFPKAYDDYQIKRLVPEAIIRYSILNRDEREVWIEKNLSLTKIDRYLPLAYRIDNPKFYFYKFTPKHTVGLNIRNVFTDDTWDQVKKIVAGQTGKRCLICGLVNRDSEIKEFIDLDLNDYNSYKRSNPGNHVECHEVWDYQITKDKIGIQSLKKIIPLCNKCHMMFHEDVLLSKLKDKYQDNYLEINDRMHEVKLRREWVMRQTGAVMDAHMLINNSKLQYMNDISVWILDLTHLKKQDYSQYVIYEIDKNKLSNIAFSSSNIAGIDFYNESGIRQPSKTVKEIFENLKKRYQNVSHLSSIKM